MTDDLPAITECFELADFEVIPLINPKESDLDLEFRKLRA
jgi:hypothetical protein